MVYQVSSSLVSYLASLNACISDIDSVRKWYFSGYQSSLGYLKTHAKTPNAVRKIQETNLR